MAVRPVQHGRHRKVKSRRHIHHSVLKIIGSLAVVGIVFAGLANQGDDSHQAVTTGPTQPAPAPSPSPTNLNGPYLTFATWNIAKPANTAVPKWLKRRAAIGNTIAASNADVLAVQEANAVYITNDKGKKLTTWQDVQALAKTSGFVAPKEEINTCKSGCVHTAHLLFLKSSVEQVKLATGKPSAGQGMLREIASGLHSAKFREFSWAFLQSKNGSGPFLVVSVHLNNGTTKQRMSDRAKVGKGMKPWANKMMAQAGLENIPVIVLGDFNSYESREPKGMAYQMQNSGFLDAYDEAENMSATSKNSVTVQYSNKIRSGWPAKPLMRKNPARIDYVMYLAKKLKADTYIALPHTLDNGKFDPKYHASDHIMVASIINFNYVPE